jgi:type II secretory pathway component PulM
VRPILTTANIAFLGFHYYALWVLATTFAAGLVWWAGVLTVLGPPLALVAFVCSILKPRGRTALVINSVVLTVYLVIWIPLIPRLPFGSD